MLKKALDKMRTELWMAFAHQTGIRIMPSEFIDGPVLLVPSELYEKLKELNPKEPEDGE